MKGGGAPLTSRLDCTPQVPCSLLFLFVLSFGKRSLFWVKSERASKSELLLLTYMIHMNVVRETLTGRNWHQYEKLLTNVDCFYSLHHSYFLLRIFFPFTLFLTSIFFFVVSFLRFQFALFSFIWFLDSFCLLSLSYSFLYFFFILLTHPPIYSFTVLFKYVLVFFLFFFFLQGRESLYLLPILP